MATLVETMMKTRTGPTIMIEEVGHLPCDACGKDAVRAVLISAGPDGGMTLCTRDRKRLARMLLDRTTWYEPAPLKPGEILLG